MFFHLFKQKNSRLFLRIILAVVFALGVSVAVIAWKLGYLEKAIENVEEQKNLKVAK